MNMDVLFYILFLISGTWWLAQLPPELWVLIVLLLALVLKFITRNTL